MVAQALVFPGQGSQKIGMGMALAEKYAQAAEVFAIVDDTLNEKLSDLMWHGDQAELDLTANAQPALMAVSVAALRAMEANGFRIDTMTAYVAGHSLGEYSALVAAGVLSLPDAARLLRLRGQAMQKAVPVGKGAMAAILGLDIAAVNEAITAGSEFGVCQIANDNCPGQVVISGDAAAITKAAEAAKQAGARRTVMLPVSAPFHCRLMQPAAEAMAEYLAETSFDPPMVPVITNMTAEPLTDGEQLRSLLVDQITGMVRWRETMLKLVDLGCNQLFEAGNGRVLSGLARKCHSALNCRALSTPDEIEALANDYNI